MRELATLLTIVIMTALILSIAGVIGVPWYLLLAPLWVVIMWDIMEHKLSKGDISKEGD